jgi:hypothetical protein
MFAAVPSPAFAQSNGGGLGIGVLVGPLFDKTASDDSTFSGKTGMQFSLFLGGNRSGVIGVATEVTLQRRKSDFEGDTLTFTTLQVPLFLRINVGAHSASGPRIYIKAGPAVDFVLSAQSELFGDIKETVNVFQLDLIGGAGVEVNRFIIEGRYIQGIRSINEDVTIESIRTRAFALLFGIRFN